MQHRFFRQETQEWEDVQPETWRWEAYDVAGNLLKQFDDDGVFHQFHEINQAKLHVFKMVNPETQQVYTLIFNPQFMKLIHFYRTVILRAATSFEQRVKLYCFGYENNVHGTTVKHLMVITPTNELVITDDIDKLNIE